MRDAYYVVVSAEHDGLRKGGDPKAPSQGLYGLIGPGHVRHGEGDEADALKARSTLPGLAKSLGLEEREAFKD
jgi:hypothetical protein